MRNKEIERFLLDLGDMLDDNNRVEIANLYRKTKLFYKFPSFDFVSTYAELIKRKNEK